MEPGFTGLTAGWKTLCISEPSWNNPRHSPRTAQADQIR